MKAVELNGYEGVSSLRVVDIPQPEIAENECLIEVKATGINFAELELAHGRYQTGKQPPFIMGFEAAGVVREIGAAVTNLRVGDRVTTIVSSGGYAEYASAVAEMTIPIPQGVGFAEAATIPIQGLTAYLLLKEIARVTPSDTVLIQAAAGGVGSYLVQLANIYGARKIIALVGSAEKIEFVKALGADCVINSGTGEWTDHVRDATGGLGVDVVFEAASGDFGKQSLRLLAPFGRMVVFGARNVHDSFEPEQIQQLIYKNQTITGFNIPSFRPEKIATSIAPLLELITCRRLKPFVGAQFPLDRVREAFEALASRRTTGKVVLIPGAASGLN
jgi:NADPH2:quinone reductase